MYLITIIGHPIFLPWMPPPDSSLGMLSCILLIASIIGLYLTIITHLTFPELRNLPGRYYICKLYV